MSAFSPTGVWKGFFRQKETQTQKQRDFVQTQSHSENGKNFTYSKNDLHLRYFKGSLTMLYRQKYPHQPILYYI